MIPSYFGFLAFGNMICVLLCSCTLAFGQTQFNTVKETVLKDGKKITFGIGSHAVEVIALSDNVREIRWDGVTRRIKCVPRSERWYGLLGIYNKDEHIKPYKDISRILYEEAIMSFSSEKSALKWLREPFNSGYFNYNKNGMAFGWLITPEREQLSVSLLQIHIKGRPPAHLPGGTLKVSE